MILHPANLNVYVEVEYTSHQIKETYGEVERYFIPYETCIEWFRDVIADDEVIDIEEMFMDHITDFVEQWSGENVWCVHNYFITDYHSIEQMDRDNKLKDLLNE